MERDDLIKQAIENYTGRGIKITGIVEDPLVEGTLAVRTRQFNKKGKEIGTADWLIIHFSPNMNVTDVELALEECEFATWPPKSDGKLRFFI